MTDDVVEDDHLKPMQNVFGVPCPEVLEQLQYKLASLFDQQFTKGLFLGEEGHKLDQFLVNKRVLLQLREEQVILHLEHVVRNQFRHKKVYPLVLVDRESWELVQRVTPTC